MAGPNLPPRIERELAQLARRIEKLELSSRLPAASIDRGSLDVSGSGGITVTGGGGVTVADGGDIRVSGGGVIRVDDNGGSPVAILDGAGFVGMAVAQRGDTVALTGTLADYVSVTFTPPGGWGSYRAGVTGTLDLRGNHVDHGCQARARLGGSTGSTVSKVIGINAYAQGLAHHANVSGAIAVALQAARSAGPSSPTPDVRSGALLLVAIRTG